MKRRQGWFPFAYGLAPLALLAVMNVHCGEGNSGGSGDSCGTGVAVIRGTSPFCEGSGSFSVQAESATCGTLRRDNVQTCPENDRCELNYEFRGLDTTSQTMFTGQWSCSSLPDANAIFAPTDIQIEAGVTADVSVSFD